MFMGSYSFILQSNLEAVASQGDQPFLYRHCHATYDGQKKIAYRNEFSANLSTLSNPLLVVGYSN